MDNNFLDLTQEECIDVSAGGALGVVGGGLIVAGSIISGGGIVAVGVGVAGGVISIISAW